MEITGQVWDELQAQNTRLHQLLREKDEENLKLMTERVKSNQLYNLSKEENESMMQQVGLINFFFVIFCYIYFVQVTSINYTTFIYRWIM